MKRLFVLIWCVPALASHIELSPEAKKEFVQKRLTMMQAQLAQKLHAVLSADTLAAEQLKIEIAQLETSIPIIQNSLAALVRS